MDGVQIGAVIADVRKARGLLQEDLALLAGLDRQYLARMEGGHAPQYVERLDRVLDALGLEMVIRPRTVGLAVDNGER